MPLKECQFLFLFVFKRDNSRHQDKLLGVADVQVFVTSHPKGGPGLPDPHFAIVSISRALGSPFLPEFLSAPASAFSGFLRACLLQDALLD